ncbi:LuxR C-terminal-related transcriptional regulator [Streptomyces sp. NPDC096057]|uniref:LuxR C-terminal-related transcriptional regulator n=1 Tax=Streptomyces sp. NPDC096057 TaxID=3155543 RepID=UPI00332729F9
MIFDDITDLPDVPQAGTATNDVYTFALRSEYIDIKRCVRDLGLSEAEAAAAIDDLVRLRLLHLVHGCTYAYVAVNPLSASLQLLAVQDEALRQRQHELERLRQQMHSLLPLYRENFSGEPQHPHVQRVEDPRAARGILTTITVEAKREILFSLSTQDPWEEAADLDRGGWLRCAGTRSELLRVLLPEAARFDVRVRERVETLIADGAQVRTAVSVPAWLLIVDAEVAVVPVTDGPGLSVVREQSVVAALRRTLTGAWDEARPFDGSYDHDSARSTSAVIDEAILRMLLNGLEDKVIARRLDISLRTCQRRIAELMDALGARTRLQAGYVLGQRGREGERAAA